MARIKGQFGFVGNFDARINAPLDAREIVQNYSDLILSETWDGVSVYKGMVVSCLDKIGSLYQLNNEDYSKESSWTLISDSSEKITDINEQIKANSDAINAEKERALAAEKTNSDAIVKGTENVQAALTELQGKIPTKTSELINDSNFAVYERVVETDAEDSTQLIIDESVTNEINLLTKEQTIDRINSVVTDTVAIETSRAVEVENKLDSKIDTNTTNIATAIQIADQNKTNIENEITRAKNAESTLQESIKNVQKGAATYSIKKIESGLDSNVKEAYQLVQTIDGTNTDVEVQIPIYKDSSLKSVELTETNDKGTVGQFLKFTYITSEGEDSIVYLDCSKFLIESEFNEGLQVSNAGVVSVKLKEGEDSLSVSEEGLSFVGGKTNKIETTEVIQVSGGPLASLLNNAGITSISKDTNLQDLLVQLFTKEIYPSVSYKEATVSNSIAVPTFNLSNQTVEVNTIINIPSCTSTTTSSSSSARTLSGLTYGYSIDGVTKNTSTSISKSVSNITLSGDYSMTRSIKGVNETKSGSSISFDASSLTATEGSNVVKLSITGAKASGKVEEIPPVYKYSNLGKISESQKTNSYAAATISASSAPSNSKTVTITGVYPIYATTSSISTLTKQSLTTSKTIELALVSDSDTEATRFALQKDEEISSISIYNSLSAKWDDYSFSNFKQSTIACLSGGVETDYILYTRDEGDKVGSSIFKIILK